MCPQAALPPQRSAVPDSLTDRSCAGPVFLPALPPAWLLLGVNQRWRYGGWRASEDAIGEAEGWEEAKRGISGLHFLAVQPDADSEDLNGLWLLQERDAPKI